MTPEPEQSTPDEIMPPGECCGVPVGDWKPVRGGPVAARCKLCPSADGYWRRQGLDTESTKS